MRENRTSGSMRGCWRSRTVGLVRHRQTKGAGTDRPDLPAGGQCSTLPFGSSPSVETTICAVKGRGEPVTSCDRFRDVAPRALAWIETHA